MEISIKKIFFISSVFVIICVSAPENIIPQSVAESTTCTWTNPYVLTGRRDSEGHLIITSREETLTRQRIGSSGRGDTTEPGRLEPCEATINRAKQKAHWNYISKQSREFRGARVGNSPENCRYRPPATPSNPHPSARKLTLKKIRNSQGNLVDEPCSHAQNRASNQWSQRAYSGNQASEDLDVGGKSLSQAAHSASSNAKEKGIITGGAAVIAGQKAMAACASPPYAACPMYVALTLGLGNAAGELVSKSGQYKGIGFQYTCSDTSYNAETNTGGCDPSNGNNGGDTQRDPNPYGRSTGGIDTGSGGQTAEVTIQTRKVTVATTPKGLKKQIRSQLQSVGVKESKDGNKITMPDGSTYTKKELENLPALKDYLKSPAGKAFMSSVEKQLEDSSSGKTAIVSKGGAQKSSGGGGHSSSKTSRGGDSAWSYKSPGGGLHSGRDISSIKKASDANKYYANHGNDRVGVSQGNIFLLVTKRYNSLANKQTFTD